MGRPVITVIDGIMGVGKTTAIFEEMRSNQADLFIYVTPFLAEIERIKQACPELGIQSPCSTDEGGKLAGLKRLVQYGGHIATTHELFKSFDTELYDLLNEQNYTLIVDETLDCSSVQFVSDIARQMITQTQAVSIHPETKQVSWNSCKFPSAQGNDELYEFKKRCDNEALVWLQHEDDSSNGFIVWHFPIRAFYAFKEVKILTYQFKGTVMDCYFRINALPYSIDQRFSNDERRKRKDIKRLITLVDVDVRWLHELRENDLSVSWYEKASKGGITKMRSTMKNLIAKYNVRRDDIMWTCFKSAAHKIPNSKTTFKSPAPEGASDKVKQRTNFVPCNCRATNDHAERSFLLYMVNRFPNLALDQYFDKRGSPIDKDRFALNEMLQWIFRSRIRKGEPINIFIPSPRMKELLKNWMDGNDLPQESTIANAA